MESKHTKKNLFFFYYTIYLPLQNDGTSVKWSKQNQKKGSVNTNTNAFVFRGFFLFLFARVSRDVCARLRVLWIRVFSIIFDIPKINTSTANQTLFFDYFFFCWIFKFITGLKKKKNSCKQSLLYFTHRIEAQAKSTSLLSLIQFSRTSNALYDPNIIITITVIW